jgi:hypothetical protein
MAEMKVHAVLYWTLRGRLSPDNRFTCRPGILTPHPPRDALRNTAGDLRVELRDERGQILVHQAAVTGHYSPDHPQITRDTAVRAKVPFHPDTRSIRLWKGEVLLREWLRPEAAPVVDKLLLERKQGRLRLSWQANHPNEAPMQYVVRFSSDGGKTFNRLSARLEQPEYAVDEAQLPGGDGWIFQVAATDGVNTTTVNSAPIDLPETPPRVEITSPPDGASLAQGESLLFSADLVAFIGQRVGVKSVTWTSDRDGTLADRFTFETRQLSRGSHRISFDVVDSRGAKLTSGIAIDVT